MEWERALVEAWALSLPFRGVKDMKSKKNGVGTGHPDAAKDAAMVRKGVHKHESVMHPGKPKTKLGLGGKGKGR